MRKIGVVLLFTLLSAQLHSQYSLSKWDYLDKLKGMWLGSCIANWTGLATEGKYNEPPFLTDNDWLQKAGKKKYNGGVLDFIFKDPWLSDDDTDFEYTYLHLMNCAETPYLSSEQIFTGWKHHINRFIWVSNESARKLMDRGVYPMSTSLGPANKNAWMIDAQLTTEFFGALCPGMPAKALEISYLAIRTTANGYAVHASQFLVALYSLAPIVDISLKPEEQILWLVKSAKQLIPATSKTSDIINFILNEYQNNPDKNNWEVTRDKLYNRYQKNASENGFRYQYWYESSINFGTTMIALLYGQGDFKRTVQIGTLSGWDSDNGTSSLGGLLGLMNGYGKLVALFPDKSITEDYDIARTRDNMPDYTPEKPLSKDNFTRMSLSMIPLITKIVTDAGGVLKDQYLWKIPESGQLSYKINPMFLSMKSSANHIALLSGEKIKVTTSSNAENTNLISDGRETEFAGPEISDDDFKYFTSETGIKTFSVTQIYKREFDFTKVVMIEGDHSKTGGWFDSAGIEFLVNDNWEKPYKCKTDSLLADVPFQLISFIPANPVKAKGFRLTGIPGGSAMYVTLCELDGVVKDELSDSIFDNLYKTK